MTITFTKEKYEYFKKVVATGDLGDCDFLGAIMVGAVCCDVIIQEDEGYDGEDYCYGGKFIMNCDIYLLGKDDGYAETEKGTPYSYVSGFAGYLKGTYEETLNGIIERLNEEISMYDELKAGSLNTEMTWEKEEG